MCSFHKVGCILPIVILSEIRLGQYRDDEYRENAPHFSYLERFLFEKYLWLLDGN